MNPSCDSSQNWSPFHKRLHESLLGNPKQLPRGAALLIAVSGGQDSMALLGLLIDLQRIHKWKLHVWHGDHAWHPKSKQIAQELKNWCEAKKIPFLGDRAKAGTTSNESSARNWRYQKLALSLNKICSLNICEHVLTAHNASDRAETLLLNLARGTDLAGLGTLRSQRPLDISNFGEKVQLVRPMLIFNREETKSICNELNLPIWIDPSNQDNCFRRNLIRHKIIPLFEEIHPGSSKRIASLAGRLANYRDDQESMALLAISAVDHPKGLCRQKLLNMSTTSRATLLSIWLKKANAPAISSRQLLSISNRIGAKKPPGRISIAKHWEINWTRELVELIPSQK